MTKLQVDVLLAVLKSQFSIEKAVLERLEYSRDIYNTSNINDLILVSVARKNEIEKQIKHYEEEIAKEKVVG